MWLGGWSVVVVVVAVSENRHRKNILVILAGTGTPLIVYHVDWKGYGYQKVRKQDISGNTTNKQTMSTTLEGHICVRWFSDFCDTG